MRIRSFVVLLAAVALPSCGRSIPKPTVGAPGAPRVSWIIMSGDSDNPDREFVCQSQPAGDCTMPVSRPNDQVFADVHVYYHGAGADTHYAGSVQVGFFRGSAGTQTLKADIALKKLGSIANQSVTGIVTSTPGTYSVDFDLTATVDAQAGGPVKEQVRVVVK